MPFALEAGTPNLSGIAGLRAGVRYVLERGPVAIGESEDRLAERLVAGLAAISGVKVYLPGSIPMSGIVSFLLDALDVSVAGTLLDEAFSIGIRSGLHCAPACHRAIGTFPHGTLRASLGAFSTEEDVDRLVSAVRQLSSGI